MLYIKNQYLNGLLTEDIKVNYKMLETCIKSTGGFTHSEPEQKQEYMAVKFLFQFRTVYKNTLVLPKGNHIYVTVTDIEGRFGYENLQQVVLDATMCYIKSLFENQSTLTNFLPKTVPIPLGVAYDRDTNSLLVLSNIALLDDTDLTLLPKEYREIFIDSLNKGEFDIADEIFYNKFVTLNEEKASD